MLLKHLQIDCNSTITDSYLFLARAIINTIDTFELVITFFVDKCNGIKSGNILD